MGRKSKSLYIRFYEKAFPEPNSGCWLWTGALNGDGYGNIASESGNIIGAHVASYIIHKGFIPKGLFILHTCDIRMCVNPQHVYSGTRQQNTEDRVQRNISDKGENNRWSKITYAQARDIKVRQKNGGKPLAIAKRLNVSIHIVHQVYYNHTWKHVKI